MEPYIFQPETVKSRRKALGLTVHELGAAAGTDGPGISRLERGERKPGAKLIGRLAGALRVSPGYFFEKAAGPARATPSAAPVEGLE